MASLGEELLISADSHVIEEPYCWENQLPATCKDQAPVFPDREVGSPAFSGNASTPGAEVVLQDHLSSH